jgi:hypothetical protein
MKRWSLGVSVLSLLIAVAAATLAGGVLYLGGGEATTTSAVTTDALTNTSQICLGYRSQVLNMHIRGVYAKQMIDIFNLEMVSTNAQGQPLTAPAPAYDSFYRGTCGAIKDIIPRLSRVAHRLKP